MRLTNIAKVVTILMVWLSYGTCLHAQNEITIDNKDGRKCTLTLPSDGNYKVEKSNNNFMLLRDTPKMAEGNVFSVTCVANAVNEGKPDKVIIYNKDFGSYVYFEDGNTTSLKDIPEGKYDIICVFSDIVQKYFIFKEDVVVKEDMSLEFNMEDAKHGIRYKYYDENNEELYVDEYDIDYNLTRPGTAIDMVKTTGFAHDEYGTGTITLVSFGSVITGYETDFFVNDISDKYCVIQGAQIISNDSEIYNLSNIVSDFKTQTVANDPENLRQIKTKFHYSAYQLEDDQAHVAGARVNLYFNGLQALGMSMGTLDPVVDGTTLLWTDMYNKDADVNAKHDMVAAVRPMCGDSFVDDKYSGMQFYFIEGCMTTNGKDGGVRYINGGYDTEAFGYNRVNGGADLQFLPEHPELSFDDKDAYIEYNNCSPILSYKTTKFVMDDQLYAIYKYQYIGRYGERNETYAEFVKPEYEETADGLKHIVNNYYPMVDGEGGATEAVIFEKNSGDDTTAPALQTLTFKNHEGKITDRLETLEGTRIIVIGGDYDANVDTDNKYLPCYFTCKDAKVSLAYSVSYEDSWNDLDVVEIPEKYQWPAFGYFYESSLANTDVTNGWYDIKVSIEDASGNYQTQILRRAFKMENITDGIMDVTEKSSEIIFNGREIVAPGAEEINVFTVTGEKVAVSNNSRLVFNNASNGVYVVEATMGNGNRMVKKIIVK